MAIDLKAWIAIVHAKMIQKAKKANIMACDNKNEEVCQSQRQHHQPPGESFMWNEITYHRIHHFEVHIILCEDAQSTHLFLVHIIMIASIDSATKHSQLSVYNVCFPYLLVSWFRSPPIILLRACALIHIRRCATHFLVYSNMVYEYDKLSKFKYNLTVSLRCGFWCLLI